LIVIEPLKGIEVLKKLVMQQPFGKFLIDANSVGINQIDLWEN